jgi:hypothetical protein
MIRRIAKWSGISLLFIAVAFGGGVYALFFM